MVKRLRFFFVIIMLIISTLVAWAKEQVPSKPNPEFKTLKVGVIAPQSGPVAYYGLTILHSVELALKNINEKGTLGEGPGILIGGQRYKLEVISYDDSADPAKSVAGMRKLFEMYKVPVIIGPIGTPNVLACQEINIPHGVLFVGMCGSDLVRRKGNPLYIQDRTPTIYFGDPMAEACIDKGYKTACVLTDILESYQSWGKRFKEKFEILGGKIFGFDSVDIKSTTDFHSIMTHFKAKNPSIIFISMYEEPLALAATHALDVGYKGKFLFNSAWSDKGEKIIPLNNIEGTLVQVMLFNFYRKYPERDKKGYVIGYLKQFKATHQEDPAITGVIYDFGYIIARAMEIAGTATDAYAIRAACPKALQEGKLPIIIPNNDMLKNGLIFGAPELLLEIKGGDYRVIKELWVPRKVLE